MRNDFAVFILTHGRPDNVITFKTLRKQGYTGKIYIIIDDRDPTADRYKSIFGDMVVIFDKIEAYKITDTADNFGDMRAVVYARNASFEIAEKLGLKYFTQFDDDYTAFDYRTNANLEYSIKPILNLDKIFESMLEYYIKINAKSIAMAQGGDYIGGKGNEFYKDIFRLRKCMNTFFCSVERPFKYYGLINEDVNAYIKNGSVGDLFLTIPFLSITQKATQTNNKGLTDIYLHSGTYVKSFYSVMINPSCAKIGYLCGNMKIQGRIHHRIKWTSAVPAIIQERHKKQ